MTSEEYMRFITKPGWHYDIVISNPKCPVLSLIHPLKQELVNKIYEISVNTIKLKRVIIFGSAVKHYCTRNSDIDLCLEWEENAFNNEGILKDFTLDYVKKINKLLQGNVDISYYDAIKGLPLEEVIKREGVTIYG